MRPGKVALFVCDVQERFRPLIAEYDTVISTSSRVIRGCNALGVPVIVTEQYPRALGSTVQELKQILQLDAAVVSKTKFSMLVPGVTDFLKKHDVSIVVIVGIETHVCVLQTVLELLKEKYEVHVVVDGVSSSRLTDRQVALNRMSQAGALLCTSEMVLFQLAGDAQHPQFKFISQLAKEPRSDRLSLSAKL